jgi:hypothetical protein
VVASRDRASGMLIEMELLFFGLIRKSSKNGLRGYWNSA